MGNLIKNSSDRYEIINNDGWNREITSGCGVCLKVRRTWIQGYVEYDNGYYFYSKDIGKIYLNTTLEMKI